MLSREDELFAARISDLAVQTERRMSPRFTMFLDQRQAHLAEQELNRLHCGNRMFFGGYEGAVRRMLGIFPDYMAPEPPLFPIVGLKLEYRKSETLSHRDFLGSFMALGVRREVIGDILVGNGQTVVCLYEKQFDYFTDNIKKIGRVGVTLTPCILDGITFEPKFKELTGTVASLRLDAVLAEATGLSREKASVLIRSGLVNCNYEIVQSGSRPLQPGDVFSAKGYGKFLLSGEVRPTKKGRLFITIQKYV